MRTRFPITRGFLSEGYYLPLSYYYYYYYYYYHHHHHRIFHFSALAGKYSPILGCSNQQD